MIRSAEPKKKILSLMIGPPQRQAVIESAKRQRHPSCVVVQRVRRIESLVAMKQRADAVKSISAALGDDIDDRS